MRILLIHNRYLQSGGEDQVFARERELLVRHGHVVNEWTVDNRAVADMNRLELAASTIWSRRSAREIEDRVQAAQADVVHFHNVMPLISPAGYWAAHKYAAVVQTIHNYRLTCPGAYLFRDGKPCEKCVGRRVMWPAVQHGCYQANRAASAAVATMVGTHTALGTWSKAIDVYIALTEFARAKMIEGGLPADRLEIKPNFLDTAPLVGPAPARAGYLFVGRLSPEKGADVLVEAWRQVPRDIELRIVGDGPEQARLRERSIDLPHVRWLGRLPSTEVAAEMRRARALLVPSLWYEVFPLVILEAFAAELPVLCSDHGSLVSLVDEQVGRRVRAGDPTAWAAAVKALDGEPATRETLGRRARQVLEHRYSARANHDRLVEIYERAIARRFRATNSTKTSVSAT